MSTLVDYDDAVARYDTVIGIEVHVELGTQTKMFDGAPAGFGEEPNTSVTPVSLGPARARCPWSTARPSSTRSASASR